MNLNNGDGASFFKILLTESKHYLRLPAGFAKKYLEKGNNKKKQTVVLKAKSGDKWTVKYVKIVDRYYFINGWFKFMKQNHLQNGDFLVFWLASRSPKKSIFKVFCYAPNGCLKHATISSSSIRNRVPRTVGHSSDDARGEKKPFPKEETTDDDGDDDDDDDDSLEEAFKSDNPYYKITMTNSYLQSSGVNVPLGFCKRYLTSEQKCVNCVLQMSNGRNCGAVKCKEYTSCAKISGKNLMKFIDENHLRVGDVCVFELVNEIANVLKVTIFPAC